MTTDFRALLISLSSHMAYMQGQLEARHELDDPEDFYWYRESVLLRQKVTDALADEPPMTTDFRALCAELVDELADFQWATLEAGVGWHPDTETLIDRARAALGKDEPAVPEGREPGAADLEKEFRSWWKETHGSPYFGAVPLAAVLSWTECALARWGNPVPTPPADGEVAELVVWLLDEAIQAADASQPTAAGMLTWAAQLIGEHAELLQRQVLVPVPVSERLPRPSDCAPWPKDSDASAWCWVGTDEDGGWEWEQRSAGCLAMFPDSFTHWLPAHALPLPEVGE